MRVTIAGMKSTIYIKIGPRKMRSHMAIRFDRLELRPTQAVTGVGEREDRR